MGCAVDDDQLLGGRLSTDNRRPSLPRGRTHLFEGGTGTENRTNLAADADVEPPLHLPTALHA